MDFLILGLPRSRTAWLSNFLTYDGLFCYHEGINGCNNIEEYKNKVDSKGDSTTGLALFQFEKHFPNTKIVIIDSYIDKSVKFAKDTYDSDITNEMINYKERLDTLDGFHVDINTINKRLKEIWEYVSDKPFDKERADSLVKLNIQVMDPHDINYTAMLNFKRSMND